MEESKHLLLVSNGIKASSTESNLKLSQLKSTTGKDADGLLQLQSIHRSMNPVHVINFILCISLSLDSIYVLQM